MTSTVDTMNKQQRPGDDSPPKQAQKKTKGKTKVISEGTICVVCENVIVTASKDKEGDDAVFCEGYCQGWSHRKCIGFSKQLFKVMCESDDQFLFSYCLLACYQKEIVELSDKVKTLSLEIAQLKSQDPRSVIDETENFHSHVSNHTDQPSITSHPHISSPQDISGMITSALSKEKEKEKWQLNLIVHNLKESQDSDPHKRKESDIKVTKDLFQEYLRVQVNVTNASRIGKKSDNINKPHLLKVTVNSTREKVQVLRNCTKLCNKDNLMKSNLSIYGTPDLTPKEQKDNKALRSQLAEVNKSEKLYKIKNRVIVQREL